MEKWLLCDQKTGLCRSIYYLVYKLETKAIAKRFRILQYPPHHLKTQLHTHAKFYS